MKCSTVSNKEPVVMANYRISPSANEDLETNLSLWPQSLGHGSGRRLLCGFFDHFEKLAKLPRLYAEIGIRFGYRRSQCGKDSVFYRIDGDTVEIMAVLDKQDAEGWLYAGKAMHNAGTTIAKTIIHAAPE